MGQFAAHQERLSSPTVGRRPFENGGLGPQSSKRLQILSWVVHHDRVHPGWLEEDWGRGPVGNMFDLSSLLRFYPCIFAFRTPQPSILGWRRRILQMWTMKMLCKVIEDFALGKPYMTLYLWTNMSFRDPVRISVPVHLSQVLTSMRLFLHLLWSEVGSSFEEITQENQHELRSGKNFVTRTRFLLVLSGTGQTLLWVIFTRGNRTGIKELEVMG